jgi:plastocyanin
MKKLAALLVPLTLVGMLSLAACGKTPGGNANSGGTPTMTSTIGMAATNFTLHAAEVKANTPITFDDTINGGGTHIICVGTGNGGTNTCDAAGSGNGPSQLYGSGVTFNAGSTSDKQQFTFPNTGMYHIICTIHPGMYVDVTVVS